MWKRGRKRKRKERRRCVSERNSRMSRFRCEVLFPQYRTVGRRKRSKKRGRRKRRRSTYETWRRRCFVLLLLLFVPFLLFLFLLQLFQHPQSTIHRHVFLQRLICRCTQLFQPFQHDPDILPLLYIQLVIFLQHLQKIDIVPFHQ